MRCDCHVHVVGPADAYLQLASRTYLADVAALETLRRLGAPRGVTRFVIVQPSFYGSDNTLLLETLDALGGDGRGVAVVDPSAPQAIFDDLARRGVRGVRLNLYSTAGRADARPLSETFAALAAIAQRMRWHVEVIASLYILAPHADLLRRFAGADRHRSLRRLRRRHARDRRCAPPAGACCAFRMSG